MATSAPSLPGQISYDDDDHRHHTSSDASCTGASNSNSNSPAKLAASPSRAALRLIAETSPSPPFVPPSPPIAERQQADARVVGTHTPPPPLPVPVNPLVDSTASFTAPRVPRLAMESLPHSSSTSGGIAGRIAEAPDEEEQQFDPSPPVNLPNSFKDTDAPNANAAAKQHAGGAKQEEKPPGHPAAPHGQPYRRQTLAKTGSQSRMGNAKASRQFSRTPSDSKQPGGDDAATAPAGEVEENQVEDVDGEELTFILPELSKDGDDTGRTVRETWPEDHVMLLYMLSRYAVSARSTKEKETWIRQTPLLVLIYEGIAAGVLNFDYAPAATVIAQEQRPKRIWMNITQDGKSAIDDLREANLINGLKLSTKDYHSITAFQVSRRGLELLEQVGKDVKARVDAFIFAPKPYRRELLKIRYIPIKDPPDADQAYLGDTSSGPSWMFNASIKQLTTARGASTTQRQTVDATNDEEEPAFNEEGRFILESIGYFRYSEVTETEDVSYVSSPFVPHCVRGADAYQQLSSNAHRAMEAASGQSNIRDTLSEAIVLANPVCLIGEWIPFGSNQIVALNERLGSMDRCQGGLFTSLIDDRPTDTQFEVPPGLTEVRILDYDPVRYINFEAEINFPEEDGIVQVENFGIHLNVDGTIFYGIKVDSILDKRSDRISVDLLSRLLVDIHQDSSEIMDDLLSSYQTSLLDMVFLGDIANRGKFNMIMADQIDPFIPGLEYMDRDDFENELKQVLGDIHCAYDIGEDSVLIVGRDGMLIAGSASKRFEKVFVAYFSLLCREMFLRSFFTRIFVLEEHLKETRQLIFCANENPNHLATIRGKLNQATNDLILFTDTLGYLLESLEFIKIPQKSPDACEEEEAIFSYLDLKKQHHDILLRARDLEKLVHGAKYEVINLRQMAEVLNTSELEDIFKTVESNTKVLADASLVVEKSGASLELIQFMLVGSFAFALMDRLPGGTLNVEVPKWVETSFAKLVDVPMLFFLLSMLWMVLCIAALVAYKKRLHRRTEFGRRTVRVKVNKPIKMDRFEAFLAGRELDKQESVSQLSSEVRRVVWRDPALQPCRDPEAHRKPGSRPARLEPLTRRQKMRQLVQAMWKRAAATLASMTSSSNGSTICPGGSSASSRSSANGGGNGSGAANGANGALTLVKQPTLIRPGTMVEVEVEYDSRYGFLLLVVFRFRVDKDERENSSLWAKLKLWMKRQKAAGKQQQALSPRRRLPLEENAVENANETLQFEQELLSWFATELKDHQVIDNVELFIGTV